MSTATAIAPTTIQQQNKVNEKKTIHIYSQNSLVVNSTALDLEWIRYTEPYADDKTQITSAIWY